VHGTTAEKKKKTLSHEMEWKEKKGLFESAFTANHRKALRTRVWAATCWSNGGKGLVAATDDFCWGLWEQG